MLNEEPCVLPDEVCFLQPKQYYEELSHFGRTAATSCSPYHPLFSPTINPNHRGVRPATQQLTFARFHWTLFIGRFRHSHYVFNWTTIIDLLCSSPFQSRSGRQRRCKHFFLLEARVTPPKVTTPSINSYSKELKLFVSFIFSESDTSCASNLASQRARRQCPPLQRRPRRRRRKIRFRAKFPSMH